MIGHSGCGKTTVLNILAGLDSPTEGAVIIDGKAIESPGLDRAVVFQSHALLPWLTVMGNVSYAAGERPFGARPPDTRSAVARCCRLGCQLFGPKQKRSSTQ